MQILSYPVGIVVGLLPVTIDLGPVGEPAHLLLDGRSACEISDRSRTCTLDLGADPRVHLLELIRTGPDGQIRERVRRWINMPGMTEAEAYGSVQCEGRGGRCLLTPSWAHPEGLQASKIAISFDGAEEFRGSPALLLGQITIPRKAMAPPMLASMEVEFSDGRRAAWAAMIGTRFSQESEASLQAVPVADGTRRLTAPDLTEALSAATGVQFLGVEKGQSEITFVVEPSAISAKLWQDVGEIAATSSAQAYIPIDLGPGTTQPSALPRPGTGARVVSELESVDRFQIVVAIERPSAFDAFAFVGGKRGWLRALVEGPRQLSGRASRTAEAVAAAAYTSGAFWKRRAVVLILGSQIPPVAAVPSSTFETETGPFSVTGVRTYLREIMVPLIVWRVGDVPRPEWGAERVVRSGRDFRRAVSEVRAELDRQRIAWMEGERHPASIDPRLPGGTALAGR